MFRRTLVLFVAAAAPAAAQPPVDPAKLTLDRIFASEEFRGDRVPAVRWLAGGAYTSTQPSKAHKGASDLVRVDAAAQGTAELRVGTRVTILGVNPFFTNDYSVVEAVHRFDLAAGYITEFRAVSAYLGAGA